MTACDASDCSRWLSASVNAADLRAFEVEHADEPAACAQQGHGQFRGHLLGVVERVVDLGPGRLAHVRDHHGLPRLGHHAHHARHVDRQGFDSGPAEVVARDRGHHERAAGAVDQAEDAVARAGDFEGHLQDGFERILQAGARRDQGVGAAEEAELVFLAGQRAERVAARAGLGQRGGGRVGKALEQEQLAPFERAGVRERHDQRAHRLVCHPEGNGHALVARLGGRRPFAERDRRAGAVCDLLGRGFDPAQQTVERAAVPSGGAGAIKPVDLRRKRVGALDSPQQTGFVHASHYTVALLPR